MKSSSRKLIKVVSIIVLVFFAWSFGGAFEIAQAISNSADVKTKITHPGLPLPQVEGKKPVATGDSPRREERFQKTIDDIENILKDEKADLETKKQRLSSRKADIDREDLEIRKQFKETEEKIKDLPEVIKQRHRDFVKKYDENLNELRNNLDAIDRAKDKSETETAIGKTTAFFEKVRPPKRHQKLDPNKLPHRTEEPVFKEPRTKPEEFEKEQGQVARGKGQGKPILVAAIGQLDGLLSANTQYNTKPADPLPADSYQIALANLPTDADLAETTEVRFTPEIREKAQALGYNPVKIYEYVRNNFTYEPYYGSLKGAQQTLMEMAGNDFDQMSLLIALLRASNVPARYVYGTIEIPIEDVKNWIGIDDTNMALTALASAGIPLSTITSGGSVVLVRMEHVWCQAFVPYVQARGAMPGEGDMWVDIDPSLKNITKEISQNIGLPGFDQTAYLQTVTQNDPVEAYDQNLQGYLDIALPDAITGAVKLQKQIEALWFEELLGTLPYDIIASINYSDISSSYRHTVSFSITDDETGIFSAPLTYNITTPELAGKRISLSYSPATAADNDLINRYGGMYNVPAYLLQVKPEIRLNGAIKASGTSICIGKYNYFKIAFKMPYGKSDSIDNVVIAGGYYVPTINLQQVPEHQVLVRTSDFRSLAEIVQQGAQIPIDDYAGEILNLIGLAYFQKLNASVRNAEQIIKIVDVRFISEAIVSIDVEVDFVFGAPLKVSLSGMGIDVDRNVHLGIPIDGDITKKKDFMTLVGMTSSFYEHKIFEDIFAAESVSSVKIIQTANERGLPVYTINSGNISSYINNLQVSSEIKANVLNAVNAGREVLIPQQEMQINDWFGTGYIVTDPQTGAAGYMISGGLAGGSTTLTSISITIARILNYMLEIVATAEAIDISLCHKTVTFPGEDNTDGTKDDKIYTLVDVLSLPKEERAKYFDPHSVGYSELIEINETNENDFLSFFVMLKGFQCDDLSPYMRVAPSIVWAIEHMAYVFGAIEEENSETSDYKRPKLGIRINDGFRTKSYHDNVIRKKYPTAAKDSFHMDGIAADIMVWIKNAEGKIVEVSGNDLYNVANGLIIQSIGGVGRYSNRVHIDTRGYKARW